MWICKHCNKTQNEDILDSCKLCGYRRFDDDTNAVQFTDESAFAMIKVNVRWWDGYLETFECSEVRFGSDLLWMRLSDGKNRHIPLRQVRWFSINPESHEAGGP